MPSTEAGERVYAIGDVHGCYDLLRQLLDRIGEHSQSLPPARALHIVVLGDIVDRGPQSASVIELLHDLQKRTGSLVVLRGNHEDAMLQGIDGDLDALRTWLGVGGAETSRSFGLAPLQTGEDPLTYLRQLRATIPRSWLAWLRGLPLSVRSGDYFFTHAGIRPGVPLRRQSRQDLLWIRDDFLSDARNHGAVIVHGHSIRAEVEMLPNRIGVDTGAYLTGVLTALYLEGEAREILSVRAGETVAPQLTPSLRAGFSARCA